MKVLKKIAVLAVVFFLCAATSSCMSSSQDENHAQGWEETGSTSLPSNLSVSLIKVSDRGAVVEFIYTGDTGKGYGKIEKYSIDCITMNDTQYTRGENGFDGLEITDEDREPFGGDLVIEVPGKYTTIKKEDENVEVTLSTSITINDEALESPEDYDDIALDFHATEDIYNEDGSTAPGQEFPAAKVEFKRE